MMYAVCCFYLSLCMMHFQSATEEDIITGEGKNPPLYLLPAQERKSLLPVNLPRYQKRCFTTRRASTTALTFEHSQQREKDSRTYYNLLPYPSTLHPLIFDRRLFWLLMPTFSPQEGLNTRQLTHTHPSYMLTGSRLFLPWRASSPLSLRSGIIWHNRSFSNPHGRDFYYSQWAECFL